MTTYPDDLIDVLREECDNDAPLIIGPVFKTVIAALIDQVRDEEYRLWSPIID